MSTKTIALTCVVVCLTAGAAWAQDPKFEYKKVDEVKDVKGIEWKLSAQAGLLITTGNSRSRTYLASFAGSRRAGDNKFQFEAAGAYARSSALFPGDTNMNGMIDNQAEIDTLIIVSAKTLGAKARYDRFFTEHNSVFAAARVATDELAGKDLVFGGQLGYSRQLYKSAKHELVAEGGYDFAYENYVDDAVDELAIHSLRLFAGYTGTLTKDTGVFASVESLFNLNPEKNPVMGQGDIAPFADTRVLGKTGVTTKLWKSISFRFAFTAKYDQAPSPIPPLAGFPFAPGFTPLAETLDTVTEVTMIVSFI